MLKIDLRGDLIMNIEWDADEGCFAFAGGDYPLDEHGEPLREKIICHDQYGHVIQVSTGMDGYYLEVDFIANEKDYAIDAVFKKPDHPTHAVKFKDSNGLRTVCAFKFNGWFYNIDDLEPQGGEIIEVISLEAVA